MVVVVVVVVVPPETGERPVARSSTSPSTDSPRVVLSTWPPPSAADTDAARSDTWRIPSAAEWSE